MRNLGSQDARELIVTHFSNLWLVIVKISPRDIIIHARGEYFIQDVDAGLD
jgi:hypothetical protein